MVACFIAVLQLNFSYLTKEKKAPEEPESLQYTKHLGGTVGARVNSGLNPCRQRL